MDQHFHSNKNEVKNFIKMLSRIINSDNFDPNISFVLISRNNDLDTDYYNNTSTMILLNYDKNDIIHVIGSLTEKDYYETIVDVVGNYLLLFVFKKIVDGYLLYIKLAIKNEKIIICFSFHISKERGEKK